MGKNCFPRSDGSAATGLATDNKGTTIVIPIRFELPDSRQVTMASSGESYKSSDDEDLDFSKSSDEEWTGDFESSSSDDIVQK